MQKNYNLSRHIAYGLFIQFILNTVGTLTIIFLAGFQLINLSERIILALIAATVAQAAAMFFIVIKHLFR